MDAQRTIQFLDFDDLPASALVGGQIIGICRPDIADDVNADVYLYVKLYDHPLFGKQVMLRVKNTRVGEIF